MAVVVGMGSWLGVRSEAPFFDELPLTYDQLAVYLYSQFGIFTQFDDAS